MKTIVKIDIDNENMKIMIDGNNVDILLGMAEIIKKIEEQNNIPVQNSLDALSKMLDYRGGNQE